MQTGTIKASTKGMSRDAWLATRRQGIGGSDAGSIMGVNKWSSPLSVYMDKIGNAPEKEITEAMRQGTDLEEYVAKRFCEEMNYKVRKVNKVLVHPEHEWMLANIDRDIVGHDAGLECKTASQVGKCDYANGDIPPSYYYQCLHYMAVTGASHWYLAVLQYSKAFYVFDIPRDDDRIEQLIDAEKSFWFDNVVAKNPPLPSSCEKDAEMINVLFPKVKTDEKVDITAMDNDLEIHQMLKAQIKKLTADVEEIENRIKMKLGDHVGGFGTDYGVNWGQYDSSRFDKKRLLEEHPEFAPIIAQYTTTKPQRRFSVSKIK